MKPKQIPILETIVDQSVLGTSLAATIMPVRPATSSVDTQVLTRQAAETPEVPEISNVGILDDRGSWLQFAGYVICFVRIY